MTKKFINPGPIEFEAIINRSGDAPNSSAFIDFPQDLKQVYGVGNLVPVKVTFDRRIKYQGSLAKMGGDHAMILIRKDVREQLGKGPGEMVSVIVELDDKPRELTINSDIKQILSTTGLLAQFESMAYSHRKEYLQWIETAKKPETRINRINRMCEELSAKFNK